jgi:carboxymethylenebutenolidase
MIEKSLQIAAADGVSDAVLYAPGEGRYPGLLFYTDIFGIRPANQGMARRVAEQGYTVLMPNVFYRYGKPPFAPNFKPGEPDSMKILHDLFAALTGAMMLRTAAISPDKIAAAASFHGGRLITEESDSPHSRIPQVKGELYFGHAVEDQSMPPDAIEKLNDTLKAWGGDYQSEVYEGARHGWTVPGRDVYDEKQAERHYAKLFDLLKRNL